MNIEDTITTTRTMKKLKVQTPLGTIESDSGNHGLDVLTIIGVILIAYMGKKLIDKFFKEEK